MENSIQLSKPQSPLTKTSSNSLMSVILGTPSSSRLAAIANYQQGLTVRKAMTNDENQVSYYRRVDRPTVVGVVSVLLGEANNAMNIKNAPSPNQLVMMAEEVVDTWWMLRLDEIAYALRQGAAGMYGTAYNKFDKQTVTEWLQRYDTDERMSQVEWANAQIKKQLEEKKNEADEIAEVLRGYARLQQVAKETGKDALTIQQKERQKEKQRQKWQEPEFLRWQAEYFAKRQQQEETDLINQ